MLNAISPIDGRYAEYTKKLTRYFSESSLISYRLKIECEYFISLSTAGFFELNNEQVEKIRDLYRQFDEEAAVMVKEIEKTTNHDVKAVEYYIKNRLKTILHKDVLEFVHFGLTSQDINNTAFPLMIKDAVEEVFIGSLEEVLGTLDKFALENRKVPMLCRTHGQAASPSSLGKEIMVFAERLKKQLVKLKQHRYEAKFGGATGNFNAHLVAYPQTNWKSFADNFIASFGLQRQQTTTQIDHYDHIAELCQLCFRINTILIDFSRDVWTYISMDYFGQKTIAAEVGSSAMPHKVNPIDFENAEGNLGISNALFQFLAEKLPISRLQRDLTDSTVLRNIGVPFAHLLVALRSLNKGISKLKVNHTVIEADLTRNWSVVAEAIQTVLRREAYPDAYEKLKEFSRGKGTLSREDYMQFIETLELSESLKAELRSITPFNYTGDATK